jgi:integrase
MTLVSQVQNPRDGTLHSALSANLPKLPSVLRYEDDYDGRIHAIKEPEILDHWEIVDNGFTSKLDMTGHTPTIRRLTRWLVADTLTHLAPATAAFYGRNLLNIDSDIVEYLILAGPRYVGEAWHDQFPKALDGGKARAAKSLLRLCCALHILEWSPEYMPLVSSLREPRRDPYSKLREGDAFLNVDEESILVGLFDRTAHQILIEASLFSEAELQDIGMLLIGYQFGMRPVQIGRLALSGYTARTHESGEVSVHLSFPMAKQRSSVARSLTLNRRVKREWAPIFVELHRRRTQRAEHLSEKLFQHSSARSVGQHMREALKRNGLPGRTAYSLRHTAAQRLADSGASAEELAEFLGHLTWTTCLVYFDVSPAQAARVNKALGISETYRQVCSIAEQRFISPDQLATLKGDKQIAGAPHGIPISGIGGCESGQPACPFNPVMSCYGCPKFMPVYDISVHRGALTAMRSIVKSFEEASRLEAASSAFMQLQRTIAEIQQVILDAEKSNAQR